jgi:CspA family cold shock protein
VGVGGLCFSKIPLYLPHHPFTPFFYFFMKTGTVKFFNESKGYGFITDDNTKEDFFVHITGLNGGQIQQNDRVEFETQEGRKGVNAVNVKRV